MVTEIRNHSCLESDIIPATDSLITLENINSYRLESDNMKKKYTNELLDVVVDYYINKQLNCTEISDIIKINKYTLYGWLKKKGIQRRDKNKQRIGKKLKPFTKEHCENISKSKIGKAPPCAFIKRYGKSNPFYGKTHRPEAWIKRKKTMAERGVSQKGDNNSNWKGGLSISRSRIYAGVGYKNWRDAIFKRDNYTCKYCGDKIGHNLQAHHVIPFAWCVQYNTKLLFDIDNGITLCVTCHDELHKIINNTAKNRKEKDKCIKNNAGGGWQEYPKI